jgi:ribokinase
MGVCVLGSINLDNVCRVARIPVAGETILAEGLDRFVGGKGANQAAAAAAWGVRSALIGAVGEDEAGAFMLAHLAAAGVDVSAVARVEGEASGQANICVSASGENMIVVVGGANRRVTADGVAALDLSASTVFMAQLETPIEAIQALFASKAARAGVTILNAAPAAPEGRALFPLADIIVVNQGELALFSGAAEPATAEAALPLALRLIAGPDQWVIVTLGAEGAMAVSFDRHEIAEGRRARVVDTTGAGDCFCGVLAAALAEGLELGQAMRWANAAAALSTERAGAAPPPTLRADTKARFAAELSP